MSEPADPRTTGATASDPGPDEPLRAHAHDNAGHARAEAHEAATEADEAWTGGGWPTGDWGGIDWAAHQREFGSSDEKGTPDGRSPLAVEFELGLAGGVSERDPTTDPDQLEAGTAVVTDRLLDGLGEAGQTCTACHHSFRDGEEVVVDRDPVGLTFTLRHRGRLLGCEDGGTLNSYTTQLAADFHRGLDETNPPSGDMHPVRLAPGHVLLTLHAGIGGRPPARFSCWVCDMTFRPGDLVIHCTCSPEAPSCMGAIHRDPERGKLCYDEWRAHNDADRWCVGGGGG